MLDGFMLKLAWLGGFIVPAQIAGNYVHTFAGEVILYAGAVTAATVMWRNVAKPLLRILNEWNDAFQITHQNSKELKALREEVSREFNELRSLIGKIASGNREDEVRG